MNDQNLNFDNVNPAGQGEIERVEGQITVDTIREHLSNGKKERAQLRMVITSTYPEAQVGNQLNDSVFSFDDFGFGNGNSYEEKRVAWIDVPKGTTKEQVEAQLKKFPNARLFRILSLEPVITDEQKRAMRNGISFYTDEQGNRLPVTEEYYASVQRVVNGETGEVIDYNGLPQYRVIGFSVAGKKDIDLRPEQFNALRKEGKTQTEEGEAEFRLTDAAVESKIKQADEY